MTNIMQYFNELIQLTPQNLSDFQVLIFWLLVLAIIALWCFINIIGYLGSSYLIKYTDIENKYPKLKRIINYFLKANYVLIILQIIYIIVIYIYIIGACFSLLYIN
jgi:hypothetical protein